jgi:hypothetical protein
MAITSERLKKLFHTKKEAERALAEYEKLVTIEKIFDTGGDQHRPGPEFWAEKKKRESEQKDV